MRQQGWVVGMLLMVAVLATACGPGGGGQPGGGQPGGGGAGGGVSVDEKEWQITLGAKEVSAGTVKFTVKNDGSVEHNFVIKEANVRLDGIQPGTSKEFTANLKPGTYTVLCDIPGHEEAGMKATLTVK